MYQSVIRPPAGNNDLIRIWTSEANSSPVVDGSILIVPPGTTAFVAINGTLSRPYGPGRYEIFTGTDAFFVRFRNIMTRGDPGTTVSVFFVATGRTKFVRLGTGEFPFKQNFQDKKDLSITMKALAACSLSYSISDPAKVVSKLVGSYSFCDDDIDPCVEQMILGPIREAISRAISRIASITECNNHLSEISSAAAATVRSRLAEYGISLGRFDVIAVNIPDSEIQRLYALEQQYMSGVISTDLQDYNIKKIWGGSVNSRTLAETLTHIPSRGQGPSGGNGAAGNPCGNGGAGGGMAELLLISQLLPFLREPLANFAQHTDLFHGTPNDAQSSTSSAQAPPPMPEPCKRCPSCRGRIKRDLRICPICGHRF